VILRNLEILHRAMREAGFTPLEGEWWHFDDADYLHEPVSVIKAADLGIVIR
jgi:beta-N-acetylhexosaminidase/D-alanyl-D-alanine dipeptidase